MLVSSQWVLFYCASDYGHATNRQKPRSYGGNGGTGLATLPGGALVIDSQRPFGNRLGQVEAPQRCVLIGECTKGGGAFVDQAGGIGTPHDGWVVWWHRRGRESNFSFVDGHVKTVQTSLKGPSYQEGNSPWVCVYTMKASDDSVIPYGRY